MYSIVLSYAEERSGQIRQFPGVFAFLEDFLDNDFSQISTPFKLGDDYITEYETHLNLQ